ncbi:hypothetical protein RRG08_048088 [Elysia crispata]|uniref:Uncharacterized protein n=1 Tax=Elysia crispata TaxID=231223 RepID=A0AAE1B5J2_9GAST|nr:hypothetical protein RRG08_048088 [Elysia crispata]
MAAREVTLFEGLLRFHHHWRPLNHPSLLDDNSVGYEIYESRVKKHVMLNAVSEWKDSKPESSAVDCFLIITLLEQVHRAKSKHYDFQPETGPNLVYCCSCPMEDPTESILVVCTGQFGRFRLNLLSRSVLAGFILQILPLILLGDKAAVSTELWCPTSGLQERVVPPQPGSVRTRVFFLEQDRCVWTPPRSDLMYTMMRLTRSTAAV